MKRTESFVYLGQNSHESVKEMAVEAAGALTPHCRDCTTTIIVLYVSRDGVAGHVQALIEPRWYVALKLLASYLFGKDLVWKW